MEEKKIAKILTPLNGLLIAISFLTRIPAKPLAYDDQSWRWSSGFFPFCGFIIGVLAITPIFIIFTFYSHTNNMTLFFLTPIFYIAVNAWLTRFLHLDGFCDCCDAFSAMTMNPSERLKIMKDPHVGSSATGAAIILFIAKAQILYLIVTRHVLIEGNVTMIFITFISIPVIARVMMLFLAAFSKYPRKKGTAMSIVGKIPWYSLLLGALTLLPLMLMNSTFRQQGPEKSIIEQLFFMLIKTRFILPLSLSILVTIYWRTKANKKLGGVTGDVLGACCESVEVVAGLGFLLAV